MGRAQTLADVITILKEHEGFYREKGVTRLAVFGSMARGDAGPHSDVDLVIDLDPDIKFSYIDLGIVEDNSADWLGCPVDVVLLRSVKPLLIPNIEADRVDIF